MTVLAPQGDGMCGCCGIERCPAGESLAGPGILVPLPAEYPLSHGRLLCPLAHQGRHFVFAGAGSGVDVMSAIGIAEQVYMRVDEAGQNSFAAQVHQFAMKTTNPAYLSLSPTAIMCPLMPSIAMAWARGRAASMV